MMNNIHNEPSSSSALEALAMTFRLAVAITDDMEQGLRLIGLTRVRATVIVTLLQHGPVTQRALSELLGVTPRNVTTLVDALEGKDLVERRPAPNDRRATIVDLTEEGRQIGSQLDEQGATLAETLFANVPDADVTAYVRTIAHVIATLPSTAQ